MFHAWLLNLIVCRSLYRQSVAHFSSPFYRRDSPCPCPLRPTLTMAARWMVASSLHTHPPSMEQTASWVRNPVVFHSHTSDQSHIMFFLAFQFRKAHYPSCEHARALFSSLSSQAIEAMQQEAQEMKLEKPLLQWVTLAWIWSRIAPKRLFTEPQLSSVIKVE